MSNPVARWQIITKDPERHSAFYRDVFDWQISADNALNYREATSGRDDGPDGGFWPAPSDGPCSVQLYIEVEDVDAAVARATEHGAQVVMPTQQLPDGDVMALLVDIEGLGFGVFRSASSS
jgi:hypothetical protein